MVALDELLEVYQPRPAPLFRPGRIVLAKGSNRTAGRWRFAERICAAYPEAEVVEAFGTPHNRVDLGESDPLRRHVEDKVMLHKMLDHFANAKPLAVHAENSRVRAIPTGARLEITERLKTIARRHRLRVLVCGCKNPDITSGSCHISGRWPRASNGQLELFTPC